MIHERGRRLKLTNEVRTLTMHRDGRRSVDANVRVRGLDARVRGRGFVREWHQPLELTIREQDTVRRVELPAERTRLMLKLAPVAGYVLVRAFMKKGRTT